MEVVKEYCLSFNSVQNKHSQSLITHTHTHKNNPIRMPLFQLVFSLMTLYQLSDNSSFPCYEADGSVRGGIQNMSGFQKQ